MLSLCSNCSLGIWSVLNLQVFKVGELDRDDSDELVVDEEEEEEEEKVEDLGDVSPVKIESLADWAWAIFEDVWFRLEQ